MPCLSAKCCAAAVKSSAVAHVCGLALLCLCILLGHVPLKLLYPALRCAVPLCAVLQAQGLMSRLFGPRGGKPDDVTVVVALVT